MDKVRKITLVELTEIIKNLSVGKAIYFAEDFDGEEALSWHTARKFGKKDENGIIVRHCGGTQFALWIDDTDYLETESLVDYMTSNSALGGDYTENDYVYLEIK